MLGYTISISLVDLPPAGGAFARRCGDELWSHRLCSTVGIASTPRIRSGGRTLRRREKTPPFLVQRSTPLHGLCASHRTIQSARDGDLPARAGLASVSLRHPRHAG